MKENVRKVIEAITARFDRSRKVKGFKDGSIRFPIITDTGEKTWLFLNKEEADEFLALGELVKQQPKGIH